MEKNGDNNFVSDELVIGVTMGDPGGIGPEIVVKALADPVIRRQAKFIIFGMAEHLEYAADATEIVPYWLRHQHEKISGDYWRITTNTLLRRGFTVPIRLRGRHRYAFASMR